MSDARINHEQAQELTKALSEALAQNGLSRHLRRVWTFKKQCLVADFGYRRVRFAFEFTSTSNGIYSLDLVKRGNQIQPSSATVLSHRKERLVRESTLIETISLAIVTMIDLIYRINSSQRAQGWIRPFSESDRSPVVSTFNQNLSPNAPRLKVGILTLPLGKNYGGNLQAYALMETLRDLDCDPILLDRRYTLTGEDESTSNSTQDGESLITNKIGSEINHENRFFIEQNILPITRTFRNSDALRNKISSYKLDVVIAGSDQVWRPQYARGLLSDFFHGYLDISERNIKRISYAASFGSDSWEYTNKQTGEASRLVKLFDAVSVREDSAVDMCRDHLGVEAMQVLDPTLLLTPERYRRLFKYKLDVKPKRQLTSYILNPSPEKQHFTNDISNQLSMEITSANSNSYGVGKGLNDKSVESWLAEFYKADFIVTDSFHGVAFSIIFNKPFVALANPHRGVARFKSILKLFDLEDRLVVDVSTAHVKQLLLPIDWISVNRHLDIARRKSIDFLRNALTQHKKKFPLDNRNDEAADNSFSSPIPIEDSAVKLLWPQSSTVGASIKKKNVSLSVAYNNPLKTLCTGCGACESESRGSLRMAWDKDGFLSPEGSGKRIVESAVRVCPFNPHPEKVVRDEDAIGRIFHPIASNAYPRAGRFENSYIGYSKSFRATSSSGGLATFIFDQLLRRNEVDYLFIVRGDSEHGYHYQIFDGKDEIQSISKTRYFPVSMESLFTLIDNTEGRVGISGVACFIKAVRLKQHYNPDLRERIVFLVGIICGGLKSRHYTDFLAQSAGLDGDYVDAQYRVKNPESDANDYLFAATEVKTDTTHQVPMRQLGDMWGSGLFKNKACDFCTDVLTELADISLGDAWLPEYNRDGMGNSVIVTRSVLADQIIKDGIASGELQVVSAPIDLVLRSQSGGVNHKLNALKFRLWMNRKFTDIPIPACRTNLEKNVSAADMAVQVLRERVRFNSHRFWRDSGNVFQFNRRMRSSRSMLQAVTLARKNQPTEVYKQFAAALLPNGTDRQHTLPAIRPFIRWLQRKLFTHELNLHDLMPLLPHGQRIALPPQ